MTINSPDSLPDDDPQEGAATVQGKGDGGVPGSSGGSSDGVGIGADAEPNTFEPEEDPDVTDGPQAD
jgi:hypothetical protein